MRLNDLIASLILSCCSVLCFSQQGAVLIKELLMEDGHYYYKGNKFTGLGFLKGEKGQFIAQMNFKNGKMHGKRICFNSRGKTLSKDKFKNGKGIMKKFHSNDHLMQEGKMNNGNREGLWKFYHQNGRLKAEEFWSDTQKGILIWEKYFNKIGALESEIIYKDGILFEERYYNDEGDLFKVNKY